MTFLLHHRQYSHMKLMDEQGNIVRSRLASGKGANKAKVATAKTLLTIIYKVLKEGRN